MECEESAYIRATYDRRQRINEVYIRLLGALEVRWDKGGTVRAGDYILFVRKEKKIINWEQDFFYTTE